MQWIVDIIKKIVDNKACGCLEINFFKGGIASANFKSSIVKSSDLIVFIQK